MSADDEIFEQLDIDDDGRLSRADLHEAAAKLGWHWPQAPLFALLDRLTIATDLSRADWRAILSEIAGDPRGPYGTVLRRCGDPWQRRVTAFEERSEPAAQSGEAHQDRIDLLRLSADDAAADAYAQLVRDVGEPEVRLAGESAALLVIDPQRAFTEGSWMRSIGRGAATEVAPIRSAFSSCGQLLAAHYGGIVAAFTRCPFPPSSYPWDGRVADIIAPDQTYFVKPGNSALWPNTNGFAEWIEALLESGRSRLVIGGCTLNSCVRVSALQTQRRFRDRGLRVIVDVSLSGARLSNYLASRQFGGRSSVAAAVTEMAEEGVSIVAHTLWP